MWSLTPIKEASEILDMEYNHSEGNRHSVCWQIQIIIQWIYSQKEIIVKTVNT